MSAILLESDDLSSGKVTQGEQMSQVKRLRVDKTTHAEQMTQVKRLMISKWLRQSNSCRENDSLNWTQPRNQNPENISTKNSKGLATVTMPSMVTLYDFHFQFNPLSALWTYSQRPPS